MNHLDPLILWYAFLNTTNDPSPQPPPPRELTEREKELQRQAQELQTASEHQDYRPLTTEELQNNAATLKELHTERESTDLSQQSHELQAEHNRQTQ